MTKSRRSAVRGSPSEAESIAQRRVRLAQELGKSPFDPLVIRAARHRSPRQLDADISEAESIAQRRVRLGQEQGKSPFDPSVIRAARRRSPRQLDADIAQALSRVPPSRVPPVPPIDPLSTVLATLREIHGRGRFGDRKVFIAALWDQIGISLGMSLPDFKRWLLEQFFAGRLVLERADLVAAMPEDLVARSETSPAIRGVRPTYHFVVDSTRR
jgi:hypothetical protein